MFKTIAAIFTSLCEFAVGRNEKYNTIVCSSRPSYVKSA